MGKSFRPVSTVHMSRLTNLSPPGDAMAKQRISSIDLGWLISEELDAGRRSRTSLAVVPHQKDGWRVIIPNQGRRFLTPDDEQPLADIQHRLAQYISFGPDLRGSSEGANYARGVSPAPIYK